MARVTEAVCVLPRFQKKTGKPSKMDVDLGAKRYRNLLKALGQ